MSATGNRRPGRMQPAYRSRNLRDLPNTRSPGKSGGDTSGRSAVPARTIEQPLDLDPGRRWSRAVRALALEFGADPKRIDDEHAARTLVKFYMDVPIHEANAQALEEIRDRFLFRRPHELGRN